MGFGFDCASQSEISTVLSLHHHVDPSTIIYANPCKAPSLIRYAAENDVNCMTFDNADELDKIQRYHPNALMVLQILVDDAGSQCALGAKFGAPLGVVRGILRKARKLRVNVAGISFHVGSGCTNPELYRDAVKSARWAFDVAKEEGFDLTLLDVGGGFEDESFGVVAGVLREAVDNYFPRSEAGVRVIAEPGKFFVDTAFDLGTVIIARRGPAWDESMDEVIRMMDHAVDDTAVMYYISDGVYGSFESLMFKQELNLQPHVLSVSGVIHTSNDDLPAGSPWESCSIWGPTCVRFSAFFMSSIRTHRLISAQDSLDCVRLKAELPAGLLIGDWLRWERMGAYTISTASQFNGFEVAKVHYTINTQGDLLLERHIRRLMASRFLDFPC
ncbi:ornithine decarboxylase, partial [Phenoliferia sp. Uapishka_3]